MINLCCTVTNRQDLLPGMLRSAFAGSLQPNAVYIIDQRSPSMRSEMLAFVPMDVPIEIIDLEEKRGCEGSAINWYLDHVSEERVIAHEDVVFGPESIAQFVAAAGDFLIDDNLGVITYRDQCRDLVGYYDLTISPNYFHYVDVDYEDRLAQHGIHPTVVYCGVDHLRNGTMKGFTPEQQAEYAVRDEIARVNYEAKWSRPVTPGGETIGRGWHRRNVWGWK